MTADPAAPGENTPAVVMAPELAAHDTDGLKLPVPTTVAAHVAVEDVSIEVGEQLTLTLVIDDPDEGST